MDARTGIRPEQSAGHAAHGPSGRAESGERPSPGKGGNGEAIALYLHIPFCLSKCPYCDFNTYEGIEPQIDGYVAALAREIEIWGQLLDRPRVTSVYFGGGTPSYIPPGSIDSTMAATRASFDVLPSAEISMEANPGDITAARVEAWRTSGINRMSIGVQSFDDDLLVSLGRRHTSGQAAEAARVAKSHGFGNFSLDLMFGLPNQTLDQWRLSLERCIELGPRHVSLYGLSLEPGTPMEADVRLGRTPLPNPDLGGRYVHPRRRPPGRGRVLTTTRFRIGPGRDLKASTTWRTGNSRPSWDWEPAHILTSVVAGSRTSGLREAIRNASRLQAL